MTTRPTRPHPDHQTAAAARQATAAPADLAHSPVPKPAQPISAAEAGIAPVQAPAADSPPNRAPDLPRLRDALRALDAEPTDARREATARSHDAVQPDQDELEAEPSGDAASGDPLDPLPEHTSYRDEGCHVSPSCLRCPLAACIYDRQPQRQQRRRRTRDRRLRALAAAGRTPKQLAEQFGLSPAHVRRILRKEAHSETKRRT